MATGTESPSVAKAVMAISRARLRLRSATVVLACRDRAKMDAAAEFHERFTRLDVLVDNAGFTGVVYGDLWSALTPGVADGPSW